MDREPVRLLDVIPPTTPAVVQQVTLLCLDAYGRTVDLQAALAYDVHDPWAVAITFSSRREDVRWMVGRDLLLQGLHAPVGEGDVLLWPSVDENGHAAVILELCAPDGRLVMQLRSEELYSFLTSSLALVPQGAETIDLDELVGRLGATP